MAKKLFTLIKGDQLKIAPKQKIIPKEEFSSLLNAVEIVEEAKTDVERYKKAVIVECEEIKENSFKEGYDDGYAKWTELLSALEDARDKANQNLEKMVLPVVMAAVKKIIGEECALSPQRITDIIIANVKAVAQHKQIIIYVNKDEYEPAEEGKQRIKEVFEDLQSLSIRPRDDIEPGGCISETEVGIVSGLLPHHLHVLERAFEKRIKSS